MFGKKKMAALTGAVLMAISSGVFAAQAPTGLQSPTLSTDEDSTWLCWDRPAKGDDAQYYNIYCNGKKIGSTQKPVSTWGTNAMEKFKAKNAALCGDLIIYHSFEATGLKPSTEYSFTVRAVGKDGKESGDSKSLKVKTIAVPKSVKLTDFGAVGDGKTVITKQLQEAINKTPTGGVLVIPKGTFVSGAVHLKSDMTLKLDEGATLISVNDINGFQMQPNTRYNGMLNGRNLKNLRIVGKGVIDGNGWMKDKKGNYYKAANIKRADGKKSREPDVRNYGILAKTQTEYLMDKEGRVFKEAYQGRSTTIMLAHVDNLYILTEAENDQNTICLVTDKSRDGEKGPETAMYFSKRKVFIEGLYSASGKQLTSLVLDSVEYTPTQQRSQKAIEDFELLDNLLCEELEPESIGENYGFTREALTDALKKHYETEGNTPGEAKRKANRNSNPSGDSLAARSIREGFISWDANIHKFVISRHIEGLVWGWFILMNHRNKKEHVQERSLFQEE